jgi:hypothetical protein
LNQRSWKIIFGLTVSMKRHARVGEDSRSTMSIWKMGATTRVTCKLIDAYT